MTYKTMKSTQDSLSILGYGCLRFPHKGGRIDEALTEQQINLAIQQGINYFDTGYIYANSEKVLGKILSKGLREKVFIATKMPHQMVRNRKDMDHIFEKQLERLQTDYIDYYLIHNITSFADWETICEKGVRDFYQKEKDAGRIRHIGFSYHGNSKDFIKIVDAYPWEICQIQYNYLDEHYQAGKAGLEYAARKGLGVVIMEPLRGGLLGEKMPGKVKVIFRTKNPQKKPAESALRWLWNHPEIDVVLSGMNREVHIEENCEAAVQFEQIPVTREEFAAIESAKKVFQERMNVLCTSCAYCMPCPNGVDIPTCFSWYNTYALKKNLSSVIHYTLASNGMINGKPSGANLCTACGACVKRCPQQIDIPRKLKEAADTMEKRYISIPMRLVIRLIHPARSRRDKTKRF